MTKVKCLKCGQEDEALAAAPYPGELGRQVLENACQKCWAAWQKFSVMVINDYKLRPFLPKDRGVLEQNMKKFLNLEVQEFSLPQMLTGQGKGVTKEDIIERIKQVFDPEIPVNVYDLGLIYDIDIHGDEVAIRMSLTSQHCPAAKTIPDSVKEIISRTPGVKGVSVEVVWDPPWTKERISADGREILGL